MQEKSHQSLLSQSKGMNFGVKKLYFSMTCHLGTCCQDTLHLLQGTHVLCCEDSFCFKEYTLLS